MAHGTNDLQAARLPGVAVEKLQVQHLRVLFAEEACAVNRILRIDVAIGMMCLMGKRCYLRAADAMCDRDRRDDQYHWGATNSRVSPCHSRERLALDLIGG